LIIYWIDRTNVDVVKKLKEKVRALSGGLGNVHFSYQDPIRNFDRSKVKGVVARLIKTEDSSSGNSVGGLF
jgi:structural maintenance of chromosome 2